jgi:galactokinase
MLSTAVQTFFAETFGVAPTLLARAPGRIEFIGNHTDYNGGEVIGLAINRYVWATATPRSDGRLRMASTSASAIIEVSVADPLQPLSGAAAWANYPLGVLQQLQGIGLQLPGGADIAFASDLPSGAGLSSSAAIELASLEVFAALGGLSVAPTDKVLLTQRAENQFVGVPCGMLDQAVSCFGKRDHLVHIDCAAVEFRAVPMPHGMHFWIFNTNAKHSLVDSLYATRHAECRDALARLQQADPAIRHLAQVDGSTLDRLAADWPADVRKRAQHVVAEQARVHGVLADLAAGRQQALGEKLFSSHASSRDLFGNSTPLLDGLVRALHGVPGVIGARLTGGGFGGAVMAMTTADFHERQARGVVDTYLARQPDAPQPAVIHVETGDGSQLLPCGN